MLRLQYCGGLASLCEIISSHAPTSTELTYKALLEFLLLKPGSRNQITVLNSDLFDNFMMSTTASATAAAIARSQQTNTSSSSSSGISSSYDNSTPSRQTGGGRVTQKSVGFTSHNINGLSHTDELDTDMTNGVVLPMFLELLPKLPIGFHGQIYTDLLGLLKHSTGTYIHTYIHTYMLQCVHTYIHTYIYVTCNKVWYDHT